MSHHDLSQDKLSHLIAQAMSAELYLSHFADKTDHDDYNQSLLAFSLAWTDLTRARKGDEFIPVVAVSR